MITEQIATAPTLHEELPLPPVLSAYDRLVSEDARNTFGARIEEEKELLSIERATLSSERHDLDSRRDKLSAGEIPDSEYDTTHDSILIDRVRLQAQEDGLRRREIFATSRENWWRHGFMTYDRHDPQVASLVEGLTANAETEEQPFIRVADFDKQADQSTALLIDARDEPLEFPAASIVSALSFESWEEGRGRELSKEVNGVGKSSREVIEYYASHDTPIPPLEQATALILQDGRIIITAGNAHRAGAAKLRGQTIQIKELKVWRAKELQPQEVAAEGLGILAVDETATNKSEQAQSDKRSYTPPPELSKWRRFMARVNYFRKHQRS